MVGYWFGVLFDFVRCGGCALLGSLVGQLWLHRMLRYCLDGRFVLLLFVFWICCLRASLRC